MAKFNTDSIPDRDLLNRKTFANEIAKSLSSSFINGDDSFVLGINGKWGSGKTTLMHYLKQSLDAELGHRSNYVHFDFNPWMFSGKDELLASFLTQLAKKLSIKKLKDKIASLAGALSYLDWVRYVNSTAGNIQEATKNALKNLSSDSSVHDLKKEIDEIIVKKQLRIFVFIDDLDRLSPKEVTEIFQIVKLNASFKNTVFVISYDKEVVQQILELHHGFNGDRYLEKIIQVDYRLPDLLEETLQNIFFETLQKFLTATEIQYAQLEFEVIWTVHRFKYYFATLRDIYRYFNALKMRLPALKQIVNVYDFCVLEGIRIFDYNAYELIQQHYKRSILYGPQSGSSKFTQEIENENTLNLVSYLFSRNSTLQNPFPVSDPEYFDRYFALSVSTTDPIEPILERFILDTSSRTYIVHSAGIDGKIGILLRRLRTRRIDLSAINPLIRWKAESESQFISCRDELIATLGHIMDQQKDFAYGMNFLVSILPGDDGHFNPAKFYLLYYFNSLVYSDTDSIFSRNLPVIENHKSVFERAEIDFLNRYESDHLVFQRPFSRTDFFHRLFLVRYKCALPVEYLAKMKTYLARLENCFLILRLLSKPSTTVDVEFDLDLAKAMIDVEIVNELQVRFQHVVKSGLTQSDRLLLEAYQAKQNEFRGQLEN